MYILRALLIVTTIGALLCLSGCEHLKLLRPSALGQFDTDVVALVNELPNVDHPNEAIVARLFAHGGLTRAVLGAVGVMRDGVTVPMNEFIWTRGSA